MTYSVEHIVATFVAGLIIGVVSTLIMTRKGLTTEMHVALLIMTVWMGMHTYGFFFGNEVDWFFNIAGFGAVGTFVGVNLRSVEGVKEFLKVIRK